MKKIFAVLFVLVLVLVTPLTAYAVKPDNNNAGALTVGWNLSGDVMPVSPCGNYGTIDIPGSDTTSTLIVNQPNGNTEVTATGVMKGLTPNTTYRVFLSKAYTPYTPINVVGTYKWLVLNTYEHDLFITQQNSNGSFSGTGGYPAGFDPYYTGEIIVGVVGQVTCNGISLTTTYLGPYNPGYTATAVGTIAVDGSMSGSSPWEWHTTAGHATVASGSTGWPGYFNSNIQYFTFVTDGLGEGSWHLNLQNADFAGPGEYHLSFWINNDAVNKTLLISDIFDVVVE